MKTEREIDAFLDKLMRPVYTALRTRLKQMLEVAANSQNEELETLRAQVATLTHDLANERVASGYAKQMKEELERLREEAESTLAFYAEKGRVVVARDGNAVQRLGASAEIAILKAEAARDKYKDALERIAGDPEWRTHKLSRIAAEAVQS